MVQLVECNCTTMEEWVAIIEPTAKKAREYFTRANQIYYPKVESCATTSSSDIIKGSFTIKLQSFTGVDAKVGFDVNIFEHSIEPNEDAQSEIQAFMNGSTMVPENYNTDVIKYDGEDNNNEPMDDFVFGKTTNHKFSARNKSSLDSTYQESSDERSIDDSEYTDTSEESDNKEYDDENKSKHYKRLRYYGPPTNDIYSSSRMITKIKIYQQQELCYVAPLARKKKSTVTIVAPLSERKDVVAQAVHYAKHIITSSKLFYF